MGWATAAAAAAPSPSHQPLPLQSAFRAPPPPLLLLLLLLTTLLLAAPCRADGDDDDGGELVLEAYLEVLADRRRSWNDCLVAAPQYRGSAMVRVHGGARENEEIARFLQQRGFDRAWLAARESPTRTGVYEWISDGAELGSGDAPGNFTNWEVFRPDSRVTNGAVMIDRVLGRWIDVPAPSQLWCLVRVPARVATRTIELPPFAFPPDVPPPTRRSAWATALIVVGCVAVLAFTTAAVGVLVWHHVNPPWRVADVAKEDSPAGGSVVQKGAGSCSRPQLADDDTDSETSPARVPEALRFLDVEETTHITRSLGQPLELVFPELAAQQAADAAAAAAAAVTTSSSNGGTSKSGPPSDAPPPPPPVEIAVQPPSRAATPPPAASANPPWAAAAAAEEDAAAVPSRLAVPPMALGLGGRIPGRPKPRQLPPPRAA